MDFYNWLLSEEIKPTFCISAGIHGDEKSGSSAILKYLKTKPTINIIALPAINSWGLKHNKRTNKIGHDENREFGKIPIGKGKEIEKLLKNKKIDLFCSLHEDSDNDFYIYCSDQHKEIKICEEIIKFVSKQFKISSKKIIEGDKMYSLGIIKLSKKDYNNPKHRNSFEGWAYNKKIPWICIEMSSKEPLEKRINVGCQILEFIEKRINKI